LPLSIIDHVDQARFSDFADVGERAHACGRPLGDIVAWNCGVV
jgi:hypothetical protein